jgi:hypothetical protein
VALAPTGDVPSEKFPFVYRLQAGLTEDTYADEFEAALSDLLDRVGRQLGQKSAPKRASRGRQKPRS